VTHPTDIEPDGNVLQTVVHKAAERGILVMLDMHRAGDDEKFELWYTSKSVFAYMHAVEMRANLPQTTL
jgi:aryl-phospho-beta-D-glucosidase BglC (GH1 family)